MSVKKYIISKNSGNFTTIPNKVLQNLHNYEALGLYCYLASLPPGWEFHKAQLKDHGMTGRDKVNSLLKVLEKHMLINIVQVRNQKGRFAHFTLEVDDGTLFKINNIEKSVQPFTEKPLTDNQLLVNSSYKGNNKKEINNKENISKSLSASDDAPPRKNDSSFNDFWKIYPRKKNKVRAQKIWERKKYSEIATLICEDVVRRHTQEAQWQDTQFIPHPDTYLRNERWTDDITPKSVVSSKSNSSFSNVMFGNNNSGNTYDEHGNDINPFN